MAYINGNHVYLTADIAGLSAYEVALKNGFDGTEEEWLESLKGEKGDQGIQGEKGEKGDQGIQGEKGEKGDQGIQGEKGDTPIKGDDYFTPEEVEEIKQEIREDLGDELDAKIDKIPFRNEDLVVANNEVTYTLQNPLEKVLLYPYWSESVGGDAIYIYIDDVEYECFHSELRVHTLPEDLYTYEHWASGKGTIEKEEIEKIWKPGTVIRAERVTAATVQMEDGYMKHSELPNLKQETVDAVLAALPTWEGGSY